MPGSPKVGIVVGLASIGWQSTLFLKSLAGLAPPLNCVITYHIVGTRTYGDEVRPLPEVQNIIAHEAIANGEPFILFWEEDVIAPGSGLRWLMRDMGMHKDVAFTCGICTSKSIPPEPMIYRGVGNGAYWDFKPGEIFEIDGCHTGFTLFRTEALKGLDVGTVLVNDYPEPGQQTRVKEYFKAHSVAEVAGSSRGTTDIYITNLLRKAGWKGLANANVICGHYDFDKQFMYGLPKGGPLIETKEEAVNLGCGLDWDFLDGIKPLRVDVNEQNKPDFRADVRNLPEGWTDRFAIVYSSHMLEHFDRYQIPEVFAEMVRICKPGGEIRLAVPSLEWAVDEIKQHPEEVNGRVIDVIWGGRSIPAVGPYPEMYHKMGISAALIKGLAKEYQLGGMTYRIGYTQVYRLFKPPLSNEVKAWLKEKPQKDVCKIFVKGEPK